MKKIATIFLGSLLCAATSFAGTDAAKQPTFHPNHTHQHGPTCGHTAMKHEGHTDYLHDGHMHHMDGNKAMEHTLAVTKSNPDGHTPDHNGVACHGEHKHSATCSHAMVPHGDHNDYVAYSKANGIHLHHPHGNHDDNHGTAELMTPGQAS